MPVQGSIFDLLQEEQTAAGYTITGTAADGSTVIIAEVETHDLTARDANQSEAAEQQTEPAREAEEPEDNGVTVFYNQELNGIEISFSEKPDAETRAELKAAGFRWHNVKKLWYAKSTADRLELADRLAHRTPAAEPAPVVIPPVKFVDGGGLYDGWEGGNYKAWRTDQELKALLMTDFRKAGISASVRFGRGGYSTSLTVTIRIKPEEIATFEVFRNKYSIDLSGWLRYTEEGGKVRDIYAGDFWAMTGEERSAMQENIVQTAYNTALSRMNDWGDFDKTILTDEAYLKCELARHIVDSYNRDCSNSMVDYFDRDIYDHYRVKIA